MIYIMMKDFVNTLFLLLNKFLKKNKINITLEKTRILNYKNKK